jgi:3',5'-cyclic AMP phosphodiesterase CpdA
MSQVKVAVASDLHLPITSTDAIAKCADGMAAFAADVAVLAGDIGETLTAFEQCLQLFRDRLTCPILVLAGNHDVWVRGEADSQELWTYVLRERTTRAGCTWLEGKAQIVRGVAIAGTIAWYDYSAGDPLLHVSQETYARDKLNYNMDALLIDWGWSDPEFAGMVARPFLATLDHLEADPAVRQTVVVTHVPLLECQMCRRPHDREWGFSNAYFGNLTLGRQVLARKKVSHVISGHTHVGRQEQLKTADGHVIQAVVLPSDYRQPAWAGITIPEANRPVSQTHVARP